MPAQSSRSTSPTSREASDGTAARLPHPHKSQKPGINVERALTSAGTVAYWDTQSGVTVLLFSQKLVSSPAYDEIFQKFFNGAYTAADV
jgi:hypothetical protein